MYKPIGFFDSGYGGLTVLREVQELLPQYDYVYLGDNQRAPYGPKTQEEVYEYTWECVQTLFAKGCDLVILACNTASAKALRKIQQTHIVNYPGKRVLGVIRPSAEVVGDFSEANKIIVLGTEGTIASRTYVDEFEFFSPATTVFQYACKNWVRIIEAGDHTKESGQAVILNDLKIITEEFPEIDVMLLGCTHYPIIKEFIEENIPSTIQVVSQGEILAESLKAYLDRHHWMREKLSLGGTNKYYTTGDSLQFAEQASRIIGVEVQAENIKLINT